MSRPWTKIRDIMAEASANPERLKAALAIGHGIDVQEDINKGLNPIIFFEVDSDMAARLKQRGIDNPTMLQLIGTSRVFARTAEECSAKFEALMRGEELPHTAKVEQPAKRKWWCNTHHCESDESRSCVSAWKRQGIKGGITLPCQIVDLTGIAEITKE